MAPLFEGQISKSFQLGTQKSECQLAFDALKSSPISSPILQIQGFKREFILQIDARDDGIPSGLSQDLDGTDHHISYHNRKLLIREKNDSTTEKECLAIVWGV